MSHLLVLCVWELGVAQTHQAEGGVTIAASKLVGQVKGKLVGPLREASAERVAGALSAQGGGQLSEGRVWELVKKLLKAGVSPDLEAEMKAGYQCCWQATAHTWPTPQLRAARPGRLIVPEISSRFCSSATHSCSESVCKVQLQTAGQPGGKGQVFGPGKLCLTAPNGCVSSRSLCLVCIKWEADAPALII